MEGESIAASIMAPSQATSVQIPSSAQQEPLRNASDSNLQDLDFEIVESPIVLNTANTVTSEIPARDNEDIEDFDFASESLGEESGSDSDESDIEQGNDNDDTPFQRLANFPTNFRVMYIGQDVPNSCKHDIFSKISESLSQMVWDEVEGIIPTGDIGLEKRLVIYPVRNVPEDGKPHVEYYQDSGVAICEADLTDGPYSKALEYLQKIFAKTDQDNLVDLCIIFVPQDADRFSNELLLTMRKLQEKVTLLPIIISRGKELTFRSEKEEKRRAIVKLFEDTGVEIFIWKADQMIEDRDHSGEFNSKWVETVYTKKVLTVNEFISLDNQAIYEDLQILRSRAIEFRKDRLNRERAKKRIQKCDKLVGIFRDIVIMCLILYTFFLFVTGVWHYAEWSVIPSDLASSLQSVSRASLKAPNQNVPQTIPLDSGETQPLIEVSQESSSRFTFSILNKKQYFENRKNVFEVIVTHNPTQMLGRYDVQEIGNGRYAFDIDTSGSKGEVLVEIKEKNGSSIKTVTWVQKEDRTKSNDIKEHKEESTFLGFVQDKAADACQNAISYSTYAYKEVVVFGTSVIDEIYRRAIYFGHDIVWVHVNYWVPIIWEKILNWTTSAKESFEEVYLYAKESIEREYLNAKESIKRGYLNAKESTERGYLNAKESSKRGYLNAKESIERGYLGARVSVEKGYLKTKEGSLNFARFIEDQYNEIYAFFFELE